MNFLAKSTNGELEFNSMRRLKDFLAFVGDCKLQVKIERVEQKRSLRQNSALHLYFTLLADKLNDAGLDMRKVLKKEVGIDWTMENIKEYLWRPIQFTQLKKRSTTQLKSNEIDKIYNTLNRFLGEKFGVHQEFPHEDPIKGLDY